MAPGYVEGWQPTVNSPKDTIIEALAKAHSVAQKVPGTFVIAADTVVFHGNRPLGKPKDRQQAQDWLKLLSDSWHQVVTAVALVNMRLDYKKALTATTAVRFRKLSGEQIDRYLDTGEYLDKAGAYGIQGMGGLLVREIRGDYFNVVGLPLYILVRLFEDAGIDLLTLAYPSR